MMDWIGHFFGLDNGSGAQYLFWSGIGSDLSEIAILFAIYTWIRRANCGVKGCFRIGLRKVPGTDHVVCHKHHPNEPPSHKQVLEDHQAAMTPPHLRSRG
jgi:hypothetical protein